MRGLGSFVPTDIAARMRYPGPRQGPPADDPTNYFQSLRDEAALEETLKGSRSIKGADAPALYPPWIQTPGNHQPLSVPGVIALPAIGATATILTYDVPDNWDGVIKALVTSTNAGGFQDGSGSLIWQLLVNGQAVKNYDNIQVRLGVLPFPNVIYDLLIFSKERYTVTIQNVAYAGAAAQAISFLGGYIWPRG